MKKLYIPEHISLGNEYLPGIGAKELRQLLIAVVPGLIIAVVVWIGAGTPGAQLLTMICCIGYIICCYTLFAKIDGRQSMYGFLSRFLRFQRGQKRYHYKKEEEDIHYVGKNEQA